MSTGKNRKVCFPFIGDSLGGSVFSTVELIKVLYENHDYDLLICVHELGPVSDYLNSSSIDYEVLPLSFFFSTRLNAIQRISLLVANRFRIKKYLKLNNIKILHTNDMRTHIMWGFAARNLEISHVWHQRSKYYQSLIGNYLIDSAQAVFTNSAYVMSTLPEKVGNRARVVPNLIKLNEGATGTSFEFVPDYCDQITDGLTIGFVGAYNKQKNPFLFIDVIKELVVNNLLQGMTNFNVMGLMVGKEGDISRASLKLYAEKIGIKDKVMILPYTDKVESIYDAIDILMAPSIDEAFGRNIIEAMIKDVLVVASASGGHLEIIKHMDNGVLVWGNDPKIFASQICRIYMDQDLMGKITRNASLMLEPFTDSNGIVIRVIAEYELISSAD